jgi:hypothetical protein
MDYKTELEKAPTVSDIILCACNSEGMRLEDVGDGELLLSIYVTKSTVGMSLRKRLDFLLNRRAIFGEVILDRDGIVELRDRLSEFLEDELAQECAVASELVMARDWLSDEEEEAWKDL